MTSLIDHGKVYLPLAGGAALYVVFNYGYDADCWLYQYLPEGSSQRVPGPYLTRERALELIEAAR